MLGIKSLAAVLAFVLAVELVGHGDGPPHVPEERHPPKSPGRLRVTIEVSSTRAHEDRPSVLIGF